MRRVLVAAGLVLALAAPASAVNPVLDPEDDVDVAAALAEATAVQGVCYGYALTVSDFDTGQWDGTYAASSLGPDLRAAVGGACQEVVELEASLTYTSSLSESEDSASWTLVSTLPELTTTDLEDLGLSSGDLLDDDRSATVLLNAVLSLPVLATEQAGRPPVVLEPNTAALPPDARPTGTPGSDWLRENGFALLLCVVLLVGGVVLLLRARGRSRQHRPPRFTSFGPRPVPPADWSPR